MWGNGNHVFRYCPMFIFLHHNMGFFDKLKDVFSKLFGGTPHLQFDDTEIQAAVRNVPPSFPDNYKTAITGIAENIHQVYTAANNKDFTIGIIGDFTVGKSTFVNAMLGQRILPVSANPSTAIITKIKYGRTPKVLVRYKDGHEVEMTHEEFNDFSAFNLHDFQERAATGVIQRFEKVVDAVMFVKSKFLKTNKLCIVDTLGLAAHESDNKKTIVSIRDSIATIYICSERGLSDKDMDFIATYLSPERDDFFLCINRIDLVKKTEREDLSRLVKLKLDEILGKAGHAKNFPLSKIYQVSSLYQEFANGFTELEGYREGVNYQERSGFVPIMSDVCSYVKANADESRREAVNKQLQMAQMQLGELMTMRKNELEGQKASNCSIISNLKSDIQELNKNIAYVNMLFEKLYNTLYGFSNNVFDKFVKNVNNEWENTLYKSLLSQVSFGVGDYLALEKNILALKMNVFKSMSDERYTQLHSLSPFVELTIQFMKDELQPIIHDMVGQIASTIETFAVHNSFTNIFFPKKDFNCDVYLSVEQSDVVSAMYRAVALAAVESTWIKNNNRRVKMFNAAKMESLNLVGRPLKQLLGKFFENIKQYLNACNAKAVEFNVKKVATLTQQVNNLEHQNSLIRTRMEHEASYFNHSIDLLKKSLQG